MALGLADYKPDIYSCLNITLTYTIANRYKIPAVLYMRYTPNHRWIETTGLIYVKPIMIFIIHQSEHAQSSCKLRRVGDNLFANGKSP